MLLHLTSHHDHLLSPKRVNFWLHRFWNGLSLARPTWELLCHSRLFSFLSLRVSSRVTCCLFFFALITFENNDFSSNLYLASFHFPLFVYLYFSLLFTMVSFFHEFFVLVFFSLFSSSISSFPFLFYPFSSYFRFFSPYSLLFFPLLFAFLLLFLIFFSPFSLSLHSFCSSPVFLFLTSFGSFIL